MDPSGFQQTHNFLPTQKDAVKILAKLMEKYLPQEDETGYFAWENAARELRTHPERLAATAQAAKEVIKPHIELTIEESAALLRDLEGNAECINASSDYFEKNTINSPDLADLFEAVQHIQDMDNDSVAQVRTETSMAVHDFRSLERAVQTILDPLIQETNQYDPLYSLFQNTPE